MFDFYCDVLLAVPLELVSSLPDFPSLPTFTVDSSLTSYINSAVDFLSFILPLNIVLPVIVFSEAVLHWRSLHAVAYHFKHWLPFWGG